MMNVVIVDIHNFMQNTSDISYINQTKIINIKSELLCREAEDDFFYFHNVNAAYKKLKEAVKLSPFHFKSLLLFADVTFVKGDLKEALDLYLRAKMISPNNVKVLSSLANCYYILGDYSLAINYVNKSFELINDDYISLRIQLLEIKISILMSEKKYEQAFSILSSAQNILDTNSLESIYNVSYDILNEKLKLRKKLKKSNLKII